jgi:2,3-bisphosphoglycerate-independent phosphoglycerate mutase
VKPTDQAGEDGDFDAKVAGLEEADAALAVLMDRLPTVLAVTGDHSTPVPVKGHSWHPQPVLLCSELAGWDGLERFTERAANLGSLGIFPAKHLIRLMQAHARRLDKFGA